MKYTVQLMYHGCLDIEVEADSPEEAREIAENRAESMDTQEFLENVVLQSDGVEVLDENDYSIGDSEYDEDDD